MKTNKVTRNSIKANKVFSIGYCHAQNLLRYAEKSGYNSGVYGWNYDLYEFPHANIAITTGYRPIGQAVPYELVKKYDDAASEYANMAIPYKERETAVTAFLNVFLTELTNL